VAGEASGWRLAAVPEMFVRCTIGHPVLRAFKKGEGSPYSTN
jgi:hypothetical protein